MKILLCSIAALTLSVCTLNAQQKADVVNAKKTQVVKKSENNQEAKQAKVVGSKKVARKAVTTKSADQLYTETKEGKLEAKKIAEKQEASKSVAKKVVRKEAQGVKKSESDLINDKKAKQTVKKIDN